MTFCKPLILCSYITAGSLFQSKAISFVTLCNIRIVVWLSKVAQGIIKSSLIFSKQNTLILKCCSAILAQFLYFSLQTFPYSTKGGLKNSYDYLIHSKMPFRVITKQLLGLCFCFSCSELLLQPFSHLGVNTRKPNTNVSFQEPLHLGISELLCLGKMKSRVCFVEVFCLQAGEAICV